MPLKKYLDRYDPSKIPVPRSFHDTFAGKPGLHRRESETWGTFTEDDYRQGRAHYYAYCEEVDAQIKKASSLSDPQARYAIYAQLAKKIFDEAITVSLVNETSVDAVTEHVKNYKMHPLVYYLMTKDLTVE